jgi:hypothetical protein
LPRRWRASPPAIGVHGALRLRLKGAIRVGRWAPYTRRVADEIAVFISYAHEDVDLARAIQRRLEEDAFRVWIDEGALRAGDSLIKTIITAIHEMEFVVALITDASVTSHWCQHEIRVAMTSGLNREGVKVLPMRVGGTPIPGELEDTYCAPLDPANMDAGLEKLVADIRSHHEERRKAQAAGEPLPTTGAVTVHAASATLQGTGTVSATGTESGPEPVRPIGIVKEGVGRPRNDGTRGSGLYRVPVRLSRAPSAEWARFFEQCWNRPPSFTTMHRPGIVRIHGDTVVLDGTTMDELKQFHATTIRLCAERANQFEANRLEQERQRRERDEAARREHEREVDDIADGLFKDDDEGKS